MIDLKPCPFCGGEAKPLVRKQKGKKQVSIKCKTCNARSGAIVLEVWEESAPTVYEVARYWNRRADKELIFTRAFIHEHGLDFALASEWNRRADDA